MQREPLVDIVVPVHNEIAALPRAVSLLCEHVQTLPWRWTVTIADSGSTDHTGEVAEGLARLHPEIRVESVAVKGRGLALKQAWLASDADVLVYMDVDLSTDLEALLPLVAPLVTGLADLATGSRLRSTSHVTRGLRREVLSRGYNLLLGWSLQARFTDAQCGFKAITRDAAVTLLPQVLDDGWFFDTELLVLAQRRGWRLHEVPVTWIDDPDSSVQVLSTVVADLRGVRRLRRDLLPEPRSAVGRWRNHRPRGAAHPGPS